MCRQQTLQSRLCAVNMYLNYKAGGGLRNLQAEVKTVDERQRWPESRTASRALGTRHAGVATSEGGHKDQHSGIKGTMPFRDVSDGAMRCIAPANGPLPTTGRISLQVTINGIDPLPSDHGCPRAAPTRRYLCFLPER